MVICYGSPRKPTQHKCLVLVYGEPIHKCLGPPCLGREVRSKTPYEQHAKCPKLQQTLKYHHPTPSHWALLSSQTWIFLLYEMYYLCLFTLKCHEAIMFLFQSVHWQQLSDPLGSPPHGVSVFSSNHAFKSV